MPDPDPPGSPTGPPPLDASWSRAHAAADRLFDALEALEEAGGIAEAARVGGWGPKARKKAEASLSAAMEVIDRALKQLRGGGK